MLEETDSFKVYDKKDFFLRGLSFIVQPGQHCKHSTGLRTCAVLQRRPGTPSTDSCRHRPRTTSSASAELRHRALRGAKNKHVLCLMPKCLTQASRQTNTLFYNPAPSGSSVLPHQEAVAVSLWCHIWKKESFFQALADKCERDFSLFSLFPTADRWQLLIFRPLRWIFYHFFSFHLCRIAPCREQFYFFLFFFVLGGGLGGGVMACGGRKKKKADEKMSSVFNHCWHNAPHPQWGS